jgi:hypothetical protein
LQTLKSLGRGRDISERLGRREESLGNGRFAKRHELNDVKGRKSF